ncbi:hypothetical protein BH24ACI3_BH24ACI3_01940 [soil metagenome]
MTTPQINVTPLIDVLLVLLIIFMIITPIRPSAFEAKIPSEPDGSSVVDNHPHTLVVSLAGDRSLVLNNEPDLGSVTEPQALIVRLKAVFDERTKQLALATLAKDGTPAIEKTVFIKAARQTPYGDIAKLVDAVKMSGASPISLQIDDLD